MPGIPPCFVNESLWQIPHAWTLIRTDPAPGSGISRSTISNGPSGRATCTTLIFDIWPLDASKGATGHRFSDLFDWVSRLSRYESDFGNDSCHDCAGCRLGAGSSGPAGIRGGIDTA